ncbi:MAG: hypothetical protein U0350_45640 [Caldilineaceae bacterium]
MAISVENSIKTLRYWMILGGVIAFGAFDYVSFFVPAYTGSLEIELFSQWGVITLGALLGIATSLGKDRERFGTFLLIGALGFWFAGGVVSFSIDCYATWIHPIYMPYPWNDIVGLSLVNAVGGAILGYRMNGWRGIIPFALLCALSMYVGMTMRSLRDVTPSLLVETLFADIGKGRYLILPVVSSLIWGCGWLWCPQFCLQDPSDDDD